jgi:hypothetical protein
LSTKLKTKDEKESREIRFLPESFIASAVIFLYSNKMISISLVLIENKEIVSTQRNMFEVMWEGAKE